MPFVVSRQKNADGADVCWGEVRIGFRGEREGPLTATSARKKNPARGGASKSDFGLSRYRSKPEEDVAIRAPLSLTRPKQTQRIIQSPEILEIPE